ncbi:glutamate N-acetyltransferase [Eubacterium ruminantium]|uniref:Arginine biosynthesis bifunctional protein ArgJ n=1 Tax=Eubacterium ruminantium TaxID=42322 RepID=A0A1T4PGL3_9FIRM|nr:MULTISPECIES: bifunctional ornithine acetyltransferase/N-acetylglutamate synthase [Eubacterium]MCR5367817.1 bifunctional ornithine acetyltransferase/N-acetylglutamate synthase [Eubacterium sp.]SCW59792.1 glutamate N-acetyltransferase [Eubacterium ruminantium]SDN10083.1 glutamate N-acetyltransferase [Eubacterium ruminantium]SJZ90642.1 glutamate N-acetyltransferase [Eubacterium ruminantium]
MSVKVISGGVTAAKGYKCASTRVGIKPKGTNRDLTLIVSEVPAVCVGTFTRNIVKAAPVKWDMDIAYNVKKAQAVIVNTGIANAATGEQGLLSCKTEAEKVGAALGIPANTVLTASTGVIGPQIPVDKICGGVDELVSKLTDSVEEAHEAAKAIMTTDTQPKEIAVTFEAGGKTCTIGAMCKGSGMIHPNMGTMLGFIMSDVAIEHDIALKTIREVIDDTFNMVSVDGDTSTNDTVMLLANGLAGNEMITSEGEDLKEFKNALFTVAEFLAKNIAKDGEGATRLFTCHVTGAKDNETARILAKSVITSNLTKAAVFGMDANCGRLFCAMGYSGAEFDPDHTDIILSSKNGSIKLIADGMLPEFSEEEALSVLQPDEIVAECILHEGDGEATAWGCDLTYDYVKINADYRS